MKLKKYISKVLSAAVLSMIILTTNISAVETNTKDKVTTLNFLPSSEDDLEEFFVPSNDEANEYVFKDGVFTITRTADSYSQVTLDLEQAGYEIIFDLTKDLIIEYDFEVTGTANIQIVTPSDIDFKFAAPDPTEGAARTAIRFGNTSADKHDIPAGKYSGSINLKDLGDQIDSEGELFIRQIWFYTIGDKTVVKLNKFQITGTSLGDKIGEESITEPTPTPTTLPNSPKPGCITQGSSITTAVPTTANADTPTKAPATSTSTTDGNDSNDEGIQTWVIVVIIVAVLAVAGGLVYYFMVVKKKNK